MNYASIELRVDVKDVVRALREFGGYPGVIRLDQVVIDEDIIWAGDDEENPSDIVTIHITRDRPDE